MSVLYSVKIMPYMRRQTGEEGVDVAISKIPDLIISDIMMPVKMGLPVAGNCVSSLGQHISLF